MTTAELILDAKVFLGEGPLWDDQQNCLWWINIFEGELHRYDPATGDDRTWSLGQQIGTVVKQKSGGLAVALENGFYSFDPDTEQLEPVCDPESDRPGNRFNDGKCDPVGRFWAGTMEKAEENTTGSLYCLEGNGSCRKMLSDIAISNGIVWTSDRSTMYYIDSPTRRVDAFDYHPDTGEISNRRTAFEIPDGLGYPDGMSIDAEDRLWVALWNGWSVVRFDPQNGKLLDRIELPVANVTACAFGGPELNELYITTARKGTSDEELEKQPHAGGLFRVKVDVRGTLFPPFDR